MANDNKSLGKFKLPGIPSAPRGVPQIKVTFDIDANGIVSVRAEDLGTGKSQQVTITGGTALSRDEIDDMVKNAEAHANEDEQRRTAAEARNQADHAAYSIEKQLNEHGDMLDENERQELEDKITAVRKALADDADADALHKVTEDLQQGSQLLGQKIYEASAQQTADTSTDADAEQEEGEDVVEAEIVDEDEGDGN